MANVTMFQRGWLWLRDAGETEVSLFGDGDFNRGLQYAEDMGWSFCIKVQDGQFETNAGLAGLIRARRAAFGLRHLPLMGWSTNREHAEADADKTNGLIYREGLDGFVSECETYKGDPGSEPYGRLKRFMDRAYSIEGGNSVLRRYIDGGQWGFCFLPNEPAGNYMDWGQLRRDGRLVARPVAECYPNEFPGTPSQWPYDALKLGKTSGYTGWDYRFMHPIVGAHPGVAPVTQRQYVESFKRAKAEKLFAYGFGVYGVNYLTAADRKELKTVTKPGGNLNALVWV